MKYIYLIKKLELCLKIEKGYENEVFQKKTSKFKEILRQLKIYQSLKEFEKKYIRKKKVIV